MTEISTILKELEFRVKAKSGMDPIVLDDLPPTPKRNELYIISPQRGDISIEHMISSDSWQDFSVDIYAIAHVQNMNRQVVAEENILKSLKETEKVLNTIFPRNERLCCSSTVTDAHYGTQTWVTDTQIISASTLRLDFSDTLED